MEKAALREIFRDLPTEQQLREKINGRDDLKGLFESWEEKQQQEYLDRSTGKKGLRILYDAYFKEVMNPEYDPERLESFLETVIGEPVRIVKLLPNDSVRLDDENTLLVTDIIVELQDGSIANIEVQKIGYLFTGPRCSCYLSDMMLRQYRRIRSQRDMPFSYRRIKKVYLIVLYENSPQELKGMPDNYLHRAQHVFDTGLQIDLLQRCILISLDMFRKIMHNKAITTLKEAWLTFLSEDDPDRVVELLQAFPQFAEMYRTLYNVNKDMVRAMGFFSEELRMMDKNTVQYMIDEQQAVIERQKAIIEEGNTKIVRQQEEIDEGQTVIARQQEEIDEGQTVIARQQEEIDEQRIKITQQQEEMDEQQLKIKELEERIRELQDSSGLR